MNKYTNYLKELTTNFSYHQFASLLKEIDNEVVNGNVRYLDSEFIYYFKQIIGLVNDNYLIDGKPGTLGHMLVENALINKERLTPTIAMCFLLEQKQNIGLDNCCNDFKFTNLDARSSYRMAINHYHDGGMSDFNINWGHYASQKVDIDEHNYNVMSDILHELTHVYQLSRTEQTDNIFDRLIYYDYQKDSILLQNGGNNGNPFFHQALLSEFMADEQANVFMLQLSQNHPEYFNDELIQKKEQSYQYRKNGTYGEWGANPREAFVDLIANIRKIYEEHPNEPSVAFIKSMLDKIEVLNQKSQPLIAQLQMQGISEKGMDTYYSIFLDMLYRYDGKDLVFTVPKQSKTTDDIQLTQNMQISKPKIRVRTIDNNAINNNSGFTSNMSLISVGIILIIGVILACLLI